MTKGWKRAWLAVCVTAATGDGGGAASAGATYESLGYKGKIETQAFKDPKGVRLRLRADEERT